MSVEEPIERSRASTSLVSEPMEMRCTPVSAWAHALQIPRRGPSSAWSLEIFSPRIFAVEIVGEDQFRAGVERFAKLVGVSSPATSAGPRRATPALLLLRPPAACMVLLHEDAS